MEENELFDWTYADDMYWQSMNSNNWTTGETKNCHKRRRARTCISKSVKLEGRT
jgi:hypothetical protein